VSYVTTSAGCPRVRNKSVASTNDTVASLRSEDVQPNRLTFLRGRTATGCIGCLSICVRQVHSAVITPRARPTCMVHMPTLATIQRRKENVDGHDFKTTRPSDKKPRFPNTIAAIDSSRRAFKLSIAHAPLPSVSFFVAPTSAPRPSAPSPYNLRLSCASPRDVVQSSDFVDK